MRVLRLHIRTAFYACCLVLGLPAVLAQPAHGIEGADYCKFGDKSTLFLIDRTTSYDDVDRGALFEGVEQILRKLEPGERLIVHTISDDPLNSKKIFEGCNPGCPVSFNPLDWVVGTCRGMLARRDRQGFQLQLVRSIEPYLDNEDQFRTSEIIQTIILQSADYQRKNINRFIIYSDLLENSKHFPWPAIVSLKPETPAERYGHPPRLKGVAVVAFGFGRHHGGTRPSLDPAVRQKLLQFWTKFFEQGGARDVSITLRFPD